MNNCLSAYMALRGRGAGPRARVVMRRTARPRYRQCGKVCVRVARVQLLSVSAMPAVLARAASGIMWGCCLFPNEGVQTRIR